ncbi:unnamed protein product [Alternaria alternata]
MEALVLTLVESAGAELASQIAEGLADGMHLEFLKSKEKKLEQELKVLQSKIDELGKSTIEAIRKQKITSAADRVRNCFARLREAAVVRLIDGQDGVQDRLDDMNAVLMNDEGRGSPDLLPPLAKEQWTKLQDEKNLNYGIQELEREQKATLNYTIMIERLGLSLVLLYHRTREEMDAAKKVKTMENAIANSDQRVKAWRDLQTAPEPVYKAPFIRTIQTAVDSPGAGAGLPACQAGDVLDAEWVYATGQQCWRKPSYAIHAQEFDFSFKPDTGRWIIHSMGCFFDTKLIPEPNPLNDQPHISLRCKKVSNYWVIERTVTLVILPLTLPPSVQLSKLTSWNSGSVRTFLAQMENHSAYTLIPRLRNSRWTFRGELHGAIFSFECPVLPGGTSYLAGHSAGLLMGATGLFEFAIWSSPPAITDSSQESEKKFHDLKCFHPSTSDYDEQVGYQPQVGAEFLRSLVLMVSVSYGGNPRGAMYASGYLPSEKVSLKDTASFTGDYKHMVGGWREMNVMNVQWEIQQGDHVEQPGTLFKVWKK